MDNLSLTNEYQEAIKKYELLKDALARYEQEKEELLFHKKPHLESLYLSLVGKHKIELLSIQTEVHFLKRKLEMIQSNVNQGKEVILEVIEEVLKKEMKDHYDHLNEEVKKVELALFMLSSQKLSREEEKELKKLYYKLAKSLHPDLNP